MATNIDAIYKEYPFLEKHVPRLSISRASMRRFDEELFDLPTKYTSVGDADFTRRLLLLDKNGVSLGRVGEGRWFKFLTRRDTVGQALVRIGDLSKKVCFVLLINKDSFEVPVVLYRLPNGVGSAAEWLEALLQKELASLRSE